MTWEQFINKMADFAVSAGMKLLWALAILVFGKILIKLILKLVRRTRFMRKAELSVSRFLLSFIRIALEILLILTIVAVLGVPMSSMVAIIASAAAAIGLALQGALSNFAGGIMILVFHPFHLDDFVEAGGFSGTVTDIGIFYTVLKTPDNKNVTIPNGTVMAQPVTNYSAHPIRRLELKFPVAYGTDIQKTREILIDEVSKHKMVLSDPEPFARLSAHEDSSLTFTVRVWVKRENYWTVNFDLMEAVHRRFAAENIQIPFNQLDVHISGNDAK